MSEFEEGLSRPLKKSLRVNINKISIEDFKSSTEKKWWKLSQTEYGKNMFYIDRSEDLERALGHTLEHISGQFYIQEVAASSSPYYLSNDTVDTNDYKILDMSASPGGKTTQLAEYFPNAIIIANEIDKTRLKQLGENIDRMGATNVYVTNYDGRNFKNFPEEFDKILLDAPCSGEWTAFKTDDALKWWNTKNIETIARLQKQLLESAFISLKVGWKMVYSTCTLNRMENEEVIEFAKEKFWWAFEVISVDGDNIYKRNWPHKNNTGWFFVAKIRKVNSCQETTETKFVRQNIEKLQSKQEKMILQFFDSNFWIDLSYGRFYKYGDEVSFSSGKLWNTWEHLFFFKTGINIWTLKGWIFEPSFFAGTLKRGQKKSLILSRDEEGKILRGWELPREEKDGWYQLMYENIPFSFWKIKWWILKSLLPKNMTKKQ